MLEWGLVYLILIIGATLQSTIGFGLGLLCAPLLMYISPELVPVPMILNALLLTSIIGYKNFQYVNFKPIGFSVSGGTLGVIIASIVMLNVEYVEYRALFGYLIVIAVLLSVLGFKPKVAAVSSVIAGTFSGFMGTLTSAGGAPMGILYQGDNQKSIAGNLSMFFVYINFASVLGLAVMGMVEVSHFVAFFKCLPALLIGLFLSRYVNRYLKEQMIKPLVLIVALAAGISIILM